MLKLYDCVNRRLIFIGEKASSHFWESHWQKQEPAFSGSNRFVSKHANKYLTISNGPILEAGCGIGSIVYCLHNDGYNVIGLDFAVNTLLRTKKICPALHLVGGDVTRVPFNKEIFQAWWSLGVIEHFCLGYEELIYECKNTLKKGGYLFISFPYMSPIRKLKAMLGLYQKFKLGFSLDSFYQFAYDEKMVVQKFNQAGFRVIERTKYDGVKGLKDEVTLLKPFLQKIYDSSNLYVRLVKYILNILITPLTGHMCFLILKKEA